MCEKRLSLGINVSILVISTIFVVLLSLPLRLLLDTNYCNRNETGHGSDNSTLTAKNSTTPKIIATPVDHRKLGLCPKFQYEDRLMSVFRSDYDRNCTYAESLVARRSRKDATRKENDKTPDKDDAEKSKVSKEIVGENLTDGMEESVKDPRMNSIPVAGHILVTMLLVSAIVAVVEVVRIRFAKEQDPSGAGNATSRKSSIVDLPIQRRFTPRQPMKSQRSFEMQGMHRSALRLLGARPPPLIRRSSFPTQQAKQNTSVGGTPNNRISRRQSAESDEEIGGLINALHHRTRLIRRH